jgi:TRAP transporter TAXI family solute receptor
MKKLIGILSLALVASMLCGAGLVFSQTKQAAVSLGTSTVGSRFHILAVGMGDTVSRNSDVSVTVEPIGGSDANVRALAAKRIELALLNSLAGTHGYHGIGSFKKDGKIPLRLVFQGGLGARAIVARADRGIKTPADLKGKTVQAKRKSLADLEAFTKAVMRTYGIPESEVKILQHGNTNEQLESLKLGVADAVVMPFGSPKTSSPPLRRLAQTIDLVVTPIPGDKAAEILKDPLLNGYRTANLAKGAIKGMDNDVDSLAVGTFTATRADMPDDVIYKVTKAFFENLKQFHPVHASAKQYTLKGSLANPTIPFHPGAVRYYKEIGAWTPALEKKQKELLANQ